MKKKNFIYIAMMFASVFVIKGFTASAQDWEKVNPKMVHILADNTFLKAYEVTLEPEEKSGMHTHPANFVYNLTNGKLKVHNKTVVLN